MTAIVFNPSIYPLVVPSSIANPTAFSEDAQGNGLLPSSRLYQHEDGSLEVISKHPAFVLGEQVLKPIIDKTYALSMSVFQMVKDCFFSFDAAFSRSVNVLPGANAQSTVSQKSSLEICVGKNLEEVYRIGQAGVEMKDPGMLEAAHKIFSPFFEQCFSDETYNKMRLEHDQNMRHHAEQVKMLEAKLEKCEEVHMGKSCYKAVEIGRRPALERVKREDKDIYEWKAHPGYLCATVYLDRWMWIDKFFANSGYNCDFNTNKPTI